MSAKCRACPAEIRWALMPSGKRNPLDVAEVEPEVGKGVIGFNPTNEHGLAITKDNIARVPEYVAEGITFHVSHFATCPARQKFKRAPA